MEKKQFETKVHRNFPKRLRIALDFRGVTIISLADMCNISRNSIHRYLAMERVSDFETMIKIAKALQLPQEFFLEDVFVLDQKVYSWTKENELQEISLNEINSFYNQQKIEYPVYVEDGITKRLTNSDYTKIELAEEYIANKRSTNAWFGLIKDSMKSVDEPTKRAMNKVLCNAYKKIEKIKNDYEKYIENN